MAERLSNGLWPPEAGGFIDGNPAESLCENGAATVRVDVVVGFQAKEEGAEVWALGLQLREGAVEEAVTVVEQKDFVRSLEVVQLAGDHDAGFGGH